MKKNKNSRICAVLGVDPLEVWRLDRWTAKYRIATNGCTVERLQGDYWMIEHDGNDIIAGVLNGDYKIIRLSYQTGEPLEEVAVEMAPVLHGKWKRLPYSRVWHKCTACGSAVNTDEPEMWKYCPHCGTKMEAEKNDK